MSVLMLTTFAAEEATGIASLGINLKALLLQTGTFLILYLVFRKFAMAKVVKTLADRRAKIEEGLANADLMEKRLAELKQTTEEKLKEARKTADGIIADASDEASRLIAKAEENAAKRVDTMIADAHKTMDANVAKARKELRGEMLSLITTATETILDEKIDDKKDSKLIEKAMAGVERE